MDTDANQRDSRSADATSPEDIPTKVIFATMADTTWRMFVPTVGFTLLGVWADAQFGAKPWLMFAGVGLGFGFAFLLVKRQYGLLKKEKMHD